MALIRRIGFTRFSRWGDNLGRLTVSAATHADALDGTDELKITCAEDLVKGDRVVWIDLQGVCHEHIVDTVDRVHDDDGAPETQAVCINSVNETWDDWLDDKRPSGSVTVALTSILADTRWEVGKCDQGGSASHTFYHITVREGIAELLETWGGELETTIVHNGAGIVARRVNIRALRGNQSSAKRFTWTKDLVSVKRSVASDNPKTRVYGYGKGVETEGGGYGRRLTFGDINGGKDYVEDAEATTVWGHPDGEGGILPAVASYVNEQCEDAAQLLQETKDYLEQVKEPKVTYTASVIDLYAFGRSWEGVGVGDDVAIIDKGFSAEGVRLHGRVSQIERDLLTGDATVTFGTLTDTMADMWQSVNSALKSNSQQNALYDAAAGTSVSWLIQLQQALNAQFNAVGTYKVETFELGTVYSNVPIDAETGLPLKSTSGMWAVNINGMGIRLAANLASDGQWDWRTFITGSQVSADAINTGTMRAERIRAGLLIDETGNNSWDLTRGRLSLSASSTIGGSTVEQISDGVLSDANEYTDNVKKEINDGIDELSESLTKSIEETAKKANANVDSISKITARVSSLELTDEKFQTTVAGLEASYGVCKSGPPSPTKEVNIPGFVERVGATVCVLFQYACGQYNPYLAVVGEDTVLGLLVSANRTTYKGWQAGDTITAVWDGEYWVIDNAAILSRIEQLKDSITLSVSNLALGSKASIVLSVDGEETEAEADLTGVRNAFASDRSSITISAGSVTFNSNTFAVNSTYFKVTKTGVITATSGTIGGFTMDSYHIENEGLYIDNSGIKLNHLSTDTGHIGAASWVGDATKVGLRFALEYEASYMTFSYRESPGNGFYTTMFTYCSKKCGDYSAGQLHAGCDLNMHGYLLQNAWVNPNNGGANGGITITSKNFILPDQVNSDGTLQHWYTGCYLEFKAGFLVGCALP